VLILFSPALLLLELRTMMLIHVYGSGGDGGHPSQERVTGCWSGPASAKP
jgi:hypothetical protein